MKVPDLSLNSAQCPQAVASLHFIKIQKQLKSPLVTIISVVKFTYNAGSDWMKKS